MKIKSFTLVELLIVIVIIGILMAALLPRLSGAQNLARDTARISNLNQITTAIASYRGIKGTWPSLSTTGTKQLTELIKESVISEIPDELTEQDYYGNISGVVYHFTGFNYLYLVMKKNGGTSGAILLGAKMETESKANYVSTTGNTLDISGDVKDIIPCKSITQGTETKRSSHTNDECTYISADQLRYLVTIS